MPLNFTFALGQRETFELRCDRASRPLDKAQLLALIELCEQNYYSNKNDVSDITDLGRQLYQWLDGKEGWLRGSLNNGDELTIYLDLIQTSEAHSLNPETQRVALGLAHLPWELLHDGSGFLLERQDVSVLPVRFVHQGDRQVAGMQNRPLRLLFMATSPEETISLQFEREEANILQATKDQPLALIVEESGSIAELTNLIQSYPEDYFDVFHMTGHGLIYTKKSYGHYLSEGRQIEENTPCLMTEDEVGNVKLTTVADLAKAFKGRFPRVIFLSGCHTGQVANGGTVPSMAQQLVKAGGSVVLGWARPVFDRTGIVAAKALYYALATGATVEEAVKAAQREMIEQKCPDWHLLRIYRDRRPVAALVTPLRTKQRERFIFTQPEKEFLDDNNTIKVASQFEFVGRRRPLQRCLKALRETSGEIGVFIAGMGGLGKSTLAARLCARVQVQRPNFERVVLIGPLDEAGLLGKLSSKYERFADVLALLNEPKVSLKGRLQNFFEAIENEHDKPLLLVLDDFEQNIPMDDNNMKSLRMTVEAYRILEAICEALEEIQAESRLIVTCRYLKEDTLPRHGLHLESLAAMSQWDIAKKARLLSSLDLQQRALDPRILAIADGNPRLLDWLVVVLNQPSLDSEDLLTQLEQVEQKFREDILARTLLNVLEGEEQKLLARLSVFNLPVSEDVVKAVSLTARGWKPLANSESPVNRTEELGEGISSPLQRTSAISPEIDFRAVVGKLTSLTLVESATTYATQTPEYRVTTILKPLLQPILTEEEWQITRQAAAGKIYQSWWEETDNRSEDQGREIVRLAVLAKEKEIAASVGHSIATGWVNSSRYFEARKLCQEILQLGEDYRILGTIARAEVTLGFVKEALTHYQQGLQLCPEDDLITKASILHNMADLKAQQGDITGAIALYQESLKIEESINDVGGKAATLHSMADLKAQQGDITGAIALYQESLSIKESINDVRGKAATLHQMADLKAQQGDITGAIALYQESAKLLGQVRAYVDLRQVLKNLGVTDETKGIIYLAQAVWLCLRIDVPLTDTVDTLLAMYNRVPQGDEMEALLGAVAVCLCHIRGEGHPQLEELQERSFKILGGAAAAQGVETREAFDTWFVQQRLNEPEYFIPRLNQRLEEIVGDEWVFERF
ncbi:MAG: tetratricopeptide repeat protein [Heteroscytonema crispum UTEX LB 1556]